MINFSNYNCFVILLFFRITTCEPDNSSPTDIQIDDSDDVSGSADDLSESDSKFDTDICELPIDEGDCWNESQDSNDLNDLNELEESKEVNENLSNKLYFGFNKSAKKCEHFNYAGCGGNENRFETVNDCRKACYTPLKNFLAKVTDLLMLKVTNVNSELPTT